MKTPNRNIVLLISVLIIFVLTSCNLPFLSTKVLPTSSVSAIITDTPTISENPTSAPSNPTTPALPQAPTGSQLSFTNVSDGGNLSTTLDERNQPVVKLDLQATGTAFILISLKADGVQATDSEGRPVEIENTKGDNPLTGSIIWWPQRGGGKYTLTAQAMTDTKEFIETTININVTGIPEFTPLPPAMNLEEATQKISEIFQKNYGVNIPKPALQRFDIPDNPSRSRWVGSAWYAGKNYYIELFDDQSVVLNVQEYASAAQKSSQLYSVLCKPAGPYKILIEFVDYGNVQGVNKADLITQVSTMINWVNQVYTNFSKSQGFSNSPVVLSGTGVYIPSPPVSGDLVPFDKVKALTGVDPKNFDIEIEIDLDSTNAYANKHWPGVFSDAGGGLALQGCGTIDNSKGGVNIWSSMSDVSTPEGALSMDLTHELSHLFGMYDTWVFSPASFTFPDGTRGDNWIPFTMFGWIDTDGDGIPEIIDPTPYGTGGPQP
jgi:hypothetical protein